MSAPTHLKVPNKGPNRNLLTSYLTLFTITRNPVIPVANHSSDLLHMCTQGSAISLATFVFNSQEPWVMVLDCTEKPRR